MNRFRTTEISDPKFESDHLRFITVKTPHLKGRGDICVYVPDGVKLENLPIVILMHGVYGSAWIWSQKGGAHRTAERLISGKQIQPMILAMPSDGLWGDGSAYLPHNQYNFEKWITDDVIDAVKLNIPQASGQSKIFISGLSMGGYGALRIGIKYGHLFSGISAHSSITSLAQMKLFVEEPLEQYQQPATEDGDVLETAIRHQSNIPPLRFDCGTDDLLIEYNRTLHAALTAKQITHHYCEFSGAHEWEYWIDHLEDTLRFFNELS